MFNQSMLKSSILKELYFLRHASCAEISDKTGKSFPLIQKQINEMLDEGLLEESGLAPSTGGRRPAMYRLKAKSIYTVSIAMDQYITKISVIDTNNKIAFSKELECPLSNSEGILNILYENTEDVITKSGVDRDKI